VIRQVAEMRARDPRIAKLATTIFQKYKIPPRQYKLQAAALLKWVQDPSNVYYVNEAGERLQDPIFTIEHKLADCDDSSLLLTCLFESIKLPWRLCLSGRHSVSGLKVRHIEGDPVPDGVNWTHIYCMVGTPPFNPTEWWYCEPTIQGVPLGWDVIDGDKAYLPEMDNRKGGTVIHSAPKAPRGFIPSKLPPQKHQSPAYAEAWSGDTLDSLKVELAGDLGGSTSSLAFPIAVGTATAEGVEFQWNWKKFWFGIATGAGVAIMTQLSLDVIRRATGLAPRG
jgi:hypothetical protein